MESLARYFFPGDCYGTVVIEQNFFDGQYKNIYWIFPQLIPFLPCTAHCQKFLYSRLLSMTVLLGALIGE